MPDARAVDEARDLVKQAFEDDYRTAAGTREPLIQKLLAGASRTGIPARKYAMLIEAEQAAVAGGNPERAMNLVGLRAEAFEIDLVQAKLDRLGEFLTPEISKKVEVLVRLYDHAIAVAETAMEEASLPQAQAAVELASGVAKSIFLAGKAGKNESVANDGALKQATADGLAKNLVNRIQAVAAYEAAIESLKTKPDDPAANGTVGRYLCFERNDWEQGLPSLAKGDQNDLAELAATEIKAMADDTPNPQEVFALAGRWWEAASAQEAANNAGGAIKAHAASLYESVRDAIEDSLDKQIAGTRSATVVKPAGGPQANPGEGGSGLRGEYFTGLNFNRKVLEQIDKSLAFDWRTRGPQGMPRDRFSIRWSGWILPPQDGVYAIAGVSDDGVRIRLEGRPVFDEWRDRSGEYRSGPIRLTKGKRSTIVIEYCDNFGNANFRLEWIRPDGLRELIPTECLVPSRKGGRQ